MPKSKKPKNDLRGVRKATAVGYVTAGVIFLALLAGGIAVLKLPVPWWSFACLAGYLFTVFALWFFLEKHGDGGEDEKLGPFMGRIMFEAVVKMASPVFLCGDGDKILWYNNAAEELYSDRDRLYEEPIADLFGVTIEQIRQNGEGDGVRISCGGHVFLAKYSHIRTEEADFSLILTREITEEENLRRIMKENEPVVSYIMIDNLEEMMQYDSELYRPAAAKIDAALRAWAESHNGILKEFDQDKYLFLTDEKGVDSIVASKFDILDRVRAVKAGETGLPLTLSIGVCAVPGLFDDKERAAHAALELALQRGGDQAVVKRSESTEFYGGVTRSVQKRSTVQARVVANRLMELMRSSSNVLIMGHKRADFDAYGSAVGLARMAMYCGTRVNMLVDPANRDIIGQRRMLEGEEDFLGIAVDAGTALDLIEVGTLVILTDVSNLANVESLDLAKKADRLAVIDHHRKTAEFDDAPDVEYIDPSSSSACEMIAEMLEMTLPREEVTSAEAAVMLAGIMLDTRQFTKNTGTRTFSAAMFLRERGADPGSVRDLFRESIEDYSGEAKFRRNVEIYRGCCAISVAEADTDENPVIAAKAADNLIMVDGMKVAFTIMEFGDSVKISARSNGEVNVQLIMEEMGGGGRFDGAAAVSEGKSIPELIGDLKAAVDRQL